MEQVIRLSPHDPFIDSWYSSIGRVHLLQSRIDEPMLWFEKSRSAIREAGTRPRCGVGHGTRLHTSPRICPAADASEFDPAYPHGSPSACEPAVWPLSLRLTTNLPFLVLLYARWTILSYSAAMPSGRCRPSGFDCLSAHRFLA